MKLAVVFILGMIASLVIIWCIGWVYRDGIREGAARMRAHYVQEATPGETF